MGGKKKYIETFGSFTEPFDCILVPGRGRIPCRFTGNTSHRVQTRFPDQAAPHCSSPVLDTG